MDIDLGFQSVRAPNHSVSHSMTVTQPIPIETTDAINARILAVSEDRIQGYPRNPLGEIARL
ncbi:MAG: hypothetical protein EBU81_04630, partial [Proteobacteria bacterium]|nr:hypothetical protein [Pseudomonadota bacterium]